MGNDYGGCNAVVYHEDGRIVSNVKILAHDKYDNTVEVGMLPELNLGVPYDLLVLSTPFPRSYKCRIHKRGNRKIIALYKGSNAENRQEQRYNINMPSYVESLMYDEVKEYPFHTPIEARVVNISKSGIRLSFKSKVLQVGNRFKLRMDADGEIVTLVADAVNVLDFLPDKFEVGCRLVGKEEEDDE
ncbi:MAG: PilZ domain-containing protein [Oscillospiraceae bacterium]|nr:PilZ domain-containing protein [Oscillospiraceae bacterium]